MGRIREAIVQFLGAWMARNQVGRRDSENRRIEELAQSVLDYGQMKLLFYPQQAVLVEVEELACRLRETPRTVTKVLRLLESQKRARRTQLQGLWRLQVDLRHSRRRPNERESTSSDPALLPEKEHHIP